MSLYLNSMLFKGGTTSTLLNGLLAYWQLESDSTDSVGSADGTDTGITYAAAKVGSGATGFNGSSDKIVLSTTTSLKPTGGLSISAWVKLGAVNIENRILTVGYENYPTAMSGYAFGINASNRAEIGIANNTGYAIGTHVGSLSNSSSVAVSTWTHVVGTWDGSTMKIYFNSGTPASGAWAGGLVYDATVRGGLGYQQVRVFGVDQDRWFNGDLDEVGLWDRAITADEVSYLYNGGSGRAYGSF
jgi:Concanavalin A-like lectin/glucanases superfamily